MKLNELHDNPGVHKSRTRVGRGMSSGHGKTSGRGHKGQKSRSGVAIKGFEGGQMPIHRRMPKRGFKNPTAKHYAVVNIGRLQRAIDAGKIDVKQPVNAGALVGAGVVSRPKDGVRLLAKGALNTQVNIEVTGASKAAIAAIEAAGGKVVVTGQKKQPRNRKHKRSADGKPAGGASNKASAESTDA
ncbi:MAG: 50S ribosomal protein L15 [Alphaproteobacteria bacterium]